MDASYGKLSGNENQGSTFAKAPVRIHHYFAFSLFSAICLCPATGLIALAYSLKSSAKADVNFHEKSRLYSRRALIWNIISVLLVVLLVLAILYCFNKARTERFSYYQRHSLYDQPLYETLQNSANDMVGSFKRQE